MKNNRLSKHFLFLISSLMLSIIAIGQEGYRITIKIEGNADSSLLMTCYYGNKIRLVDTAASISKGNFVFEGKKPLPAGIYMAVTPAKKKLFEFLVGKNQVFKLVTDTTDYALHMKAKNSDENQVFYDYLKYNEISYQQNKSLDAEIAKEEKNSEKYNVIKNQIDSLNAKAIEYKMQVIDNNPDLFVSALFNAMREVEVPDSVRENTDSSLVFRYYKDHYWDYFNLSDSGLLRTPLLEKKLNLYFERAVFFQPDSVIVAIDDLISQARPSTEMVSYLVWYFMSEYQNPKYMGFDNIFVHLVDAYFMKESIENTTPSVLKMLKERVDIVRPILLGEAAPNMILVDTSGQLKSLYSIQHEYTLILFWDSDCGICKKEITDLKSIYQLPAYDLEVYAVCVNSDLDKWKKALAERKMPWVNVNGTRSATPDFHDLYDIQGTPVIYLLDSEKKIIAKRISADQIPDLIENIKKFKR